MSVEEVLDYPLPSGEADRAKFKTKIDLLKASFIRDISESEHRTELVAEIKKEFNIPSEVANKLAKDLAKGAFAKRSQKEDAYRELFTAYTTVIDKSAAVQS